MTDTAFGPADHPDLPLGLRKHPRFALRFILGDQMPTAYTHTREEQQSLREALEEAAGFNFIEERWDDDKKAWVDA